MTTGKTQQLLAPCADDAMVRISNFQLWYNIIVRKDDSKYVLCHDGKIHNLNNGLILGKDYIPALVFNTPSNLEPNYCTQAVNQAQAEQIIFCMHRHGIISRDPVIASLLRRQRQLFDNIVELQKLSVKHANMKPNTAARAKVGERHDILLNNIAADKFAFLTECSEVHCCNGQQP